MWELVYKCRWYILGAIGALVIILSANFYVDKKETEAYNKGFDKANTAWLAKGQQYVNMIDKSHAENAALNQKLKTLNSEELAQEQENQKEVKDKLIEYVQSPESKNKSLSNKFIDIYNQSLGK